jgi:hypothetical protein
VIITQLKKKKKKKEKEEDRIHREKASHDGSIRDGHVRVSMHMCVYIYYSLIPTSSSKRFSLFYLLIEPRQNGT